MSGKLFQKNSAIFISIYNKIDKFLTEQLYGRIESKRFLDKAFAWHDMGYLSRKQLLDLLQMGRLRNAIVHDYNEGEVVAEPTSAIVKRVEQIQEDICRPRMLYELFQKKVVTVNLGDSIDHALKLFWRYRISQIPVLNDDIIVDVLNTNTISWWAAATTPKDLSQHEIKEVLSYSERKKNYVILDQSAKLPEAVRLFRESYSKVNKGWFMDAILITPDGNDKIPIKGIVVLEDLVDYLL